MDWNERAGQLRQQVGDLYDPSTATPAEWVAWYVEYNRENDGELYTSDEQRALLRYAQESATAHQEAQV